MMLTMMLRDNFEILRLTFDQILLACCAIDASRHFIVFRDADWKRCVKCPMPISTWQYQNYRGRQTWGNLCFIELAHVNTSDPGADPRQ
jgi:hypothetical protein